MAQKYISPNEIPDDVIRKEFEKAESVRYQARNFNYVAGGFVAFGDLGWWLPLRRVLTILGITPEMLQPVFNPQYTMVKRRFPFDRNWCGLNKRTSKAVEVELPEVIGSYGMLGNFLLDQKRFLKLAKILGKPIEAHRYDGSAFRHDHLFTAYPSGEIVEVKIRQMDGWCV